MVAIDNDDVKMTQYLIEVDKFNYKYNCLYRACRLGSLKVLKYLMTFNKISGTRAITDAIYSGKLEIIKYLVSQNITPIRNHLVIARKRGFIQIVNYLQTLDLK